MASSLLVGVYLARNKLDSLRGGKDSYQITHTPEKTIGTDLFPHVWKEYIR